MVAEEIEIIVTAKIEEALEELKKILPYTKQLVKEIQSNFENTNFNGIKSKISQAVNFIKNKISSLRNSSKNNEIKLNINNKEAEKQITQLEKKINSLQEKIEARQMKLNIINPKIDEMISNTRNDITPSGVPASSMDAMVDSALSKNKEFTSLNNEAQKLYTEIELYNKQLSEAKKQMTALKQETSQTATSQNKLTSFFNAFLEKVNSSKQSIKQLKSNFTTLPKITQSITNNIKKMSTGIKSGLGHVLKYATALFSLRGIYSVLSQSAQSWLSSQNAGTQQLGANIDYMKYAMGSALAPVIQFVTKLVYQLMKAIQSVAFALTGVNIFAKATASSMDNVAGSAKKANKEARQLAGVHEEITNVSTQDNADNGGGSGAVTPSMDLSQLDISMSDWINKIKEKLEPFFEPVKKSWDTYGQPLINSMNNAFSSNLNLIRSIGTSFGEVWTNGTGEETINLLFQGLTSIFNTIGNINEAFAEAWSTENIGTSIIQSLGNGFNNILSIIVQIQQTYEEWTASDDFQIFANSIIGIINTLSGWFEKFTIKLREIWENGGKETFTKLLNTGTKLMEAIDAIFKALTPVFDWLLDVSMPIVYSLIDVIGFLLDAIGGLLDFVTGVFTGDWKKAWEGIKNFCSNIWNGIVNLISNLINGIKNTVSNVLNAIKTVWNNIWNSIQTVVSNVWNGIWNTIKGVINSILGGIESFVNSTIRAINFVLSGISSVASAVGSIIGLNPINLKLNQISLPRLKKGGVLYEETAVIGGEYSGAKNNPEIMTPQNIMYDTTRRAMEDARFFGGTDNEQSINLTVNVGNKKLGQILLEDLRDRKRQTGKDIEALVGG